eukprot:CAMPEP_0180535366 /NCGR_PEP_ID=MMETSP1036_2-20121128/64696_1 /TAXON_ID=632150 /ORGANISM="Azadinium spinosum, Strain 3D9" /LENGTH=41 /DNA_ID= /DNA_START= /DNA_END= /DNA_ORIENTATION=
MGLSNRRPFVRLHRTCGHIRVPEYHTSQNNATAIAIHSVCG